MNLKKLILLLLATFFLIFNFYNSQKLRLDASSDTLILQNDQSFKFFNYYNKIFPSKNFLVLAVKSNKKIDKNYINLIKKMKSDLIQLKGIESIFSIIEAFINSYCFESAISSISFKSSLIFNNE